MKVGNNILNQNHSDHNPVIFRIIETDQDDD